MLALHPGPASDHQVKPDIPETLRGRGVFTAGCVLSSYASVVGEVFEHGVAMPRESLLKKRIKLTQMLTNSPSQAEVLFERALVNAQLASRFREWVCPGLDQKSGECC
ncbi:hypothetical protein OG985_47925 [Streptomyces sp. NBC_00289]|uniref:hypothetical protein n=1 Tax=Streptomyces sp. NBC_00289 TaxID=2975703 RepID=UPI003251F42E